MQREKRNSIFSAVHSCPYVRRHPPTRSFIRENGKYCMKENDAAQLQWSSWQPRGKQLGATAIERFWARHCRRAPEIYTRVLLSAAFLPKLGIISLCFANVDWTRMEKKSPMPFLPDKFEDYVIILLPTISKRNNELTNQKCLHEHLRRTRCLSGKEQSNARSLRCDLDVPEISLSSLPSRTTPRHASFPSLSA